MDLPKKYLSYSAMSQWEKDPNEFRERYYKNKKSPESPEILLGKQVAKILETEAAKDHPILSAVPRYPKPEHKMEVMVDEVPFLGYIDSFDPDRNSFLEYKTGRPLPGGGARWDRASVARHEQLDIYSLLIKLKYGSVDNHTKLIWIETRFKKKETVFAGHTLVADSKDVELCGPVHSFDRIIYQWERDRIKEKIIRIAHEIETDWKGYKQRSIGAWQEASAAPAPQKSPSA